MLQKQVMSEEGGGGSEDAGSAGSDPDDLAALLAHDMKNHLQVADRRLEGFVEENGEDRRLEFVSKSIDRMKEMTEHVLVLSKQGEENMEPETVSLSEKAEQAWTTLESPEGELVLEDPPDVEADPDGIQRLLENLFDNSITHGDDEVTVRVGSTESGFYVEDDGPGIPQHVRERVFEKGFSAGQGSGLGLYLVQRVVDIHGWGVEAVESDSGGARFEFTVEPA